MNGNIRVNTVIKYEPVCAIDEASGEKVAVAQDMRLHLGRFL